MTDHADLIVRLKRHREVMGRDMLEWELVNHDGPEAASAIEALVRERDEALRHVEQLQEKLDPKNSCACCYDYPDAIRALAEKETNDE